MFMIPGIAIKLSTFLSGIVKNRVEHARRDYSRLLTILGILELLISFLLIKGANQILLCSLFVFVYAFLKEGIPRLLFSISIYSYFVEPKELTKTISLGHVVKIFATLTGSLLASFLIKKMNWEYSLVIDAITFLLMSLGLIALGKDNISNRKEKSNDIGEDLDRQEILTSNESRILELISFFIPVISFISCLFFPYINILLERYNVTQSYHGVASTALIGFSVSILNIFYSKRKTHQLNNIIIKGIPPTFIILSVLFNMNPNFFLFILITTASSSYNSVFNTVDYSIRSKLPLIKMIDFNTKVTRKFSLAQIGSCFTALIYYSYDFPSYYLGLAILISSLFFLSVIIAKSYGASNA